MIKRFPVRNLIILLAVLVIPSLAYLLLRQGENKYKTLEIYGPRHASTIGGKDTVYHSVGAFSLTNHLGQAFTDEILENKIHIADFFFATCKTICPKMSGQMQRIQYAVKDDPDVILVSFTVDPIRDSVSALAEYAKQYQAIQGKWHFVTGNKKQIYDLARNSYFITAMEGNGEPDDFIHSEKIVLVDKEGHIRGFYDGTDPDDTGRLLDELKVLRWEYGHRDPEY